MDYPLTLLPKSNYKLINCDLSEFCLIRHTHILQENLLDDNGNLKNEVIASGAEKILPDYSTSLLGVFELENIKIKVTNLDYQEYCKPNIEVQTLIYENDFELIDNRGFWTIKIDSINDQEIEYEDGSLKAVCKVHHTPMKWNFWHFSINWYIDDISGYWHNNPDYQTPSIRRKLISEARGLLKEFGKPIVLSEEIIEEQCYIN